MARGWESKSVESQVADAGAGEERRGGLDAAERQLHARRRSLELSRARVLQELEATTAPVRRSALESALAFLDGELTKLAGG
jgi:hypothetical protein